MLTENQNLIILKSLLYELSYRRDNKLMKVLLELNMCVVLKLVRNMSSCYEDHLCYTQFKSHHKQQSYGWETNADGWTDICTDRQYSLYAGSIKNTNQCMIKLQMYLYYICTGTT